MPSWKMLQIPQQDTVCLWQCDPFTSLSNAYLFPHIHLPSVCTHHFCSRKSFESSELCEYWITSYSLKVPRSCLCSFAQAISFTWLLFTILYVWRLVYFCWFPPPTELGYTRLLCIPVVFDSNLSWFMYSFIKHVADAKANRVTNMTTILASMQMTLVDYKQTNIYCNFKLWSVNAVTKSQAR